MKATIAAFQTEYGITFTNAVNVPDEWVQLSSLVEIDFPDLPKQEVIEKQIKMIDNLITEEKGKHFATVKRLETRKAELLAITHQDTSHDA